MAVSVAPTPITSANASGKVLLRDLPYAASEARASAALTSLAPRLPSVVPALMA